MVDVSRTGEPVYIKDFAKVERRYQDPVFLVRYDGKPSVLLSVEMQKGKNVTELGDRLDEIMTQLRSLLPPDIQSRSHRGSADYGQGAHQPPRP